MAVRNDRSPKVTIEVDQAAIDDGVTRQSSHCMIADAIRRQVPGATSIVVDLQTIRWSDKAKGYRYVYLTPRVAQIALVDFDQGRKPDPFEFVVQRAHIVPVRKRASSPRERTTIVPGPSSRPDDVTRRGGLTPPLSTARGSERRFGLRGLKA